MTTDTRAALAQAIEALRLKYSDVIYDQSPELARRFESELDAIIAAATPTRQPLTMGQIAEMQDDGVFLGTCEHIVRTIERAHGIG